MRLGGFSSHCGRNWHVGQSTLKEQRQNAVAKANREEQKERGEKGCPEFLNSAFRHHLMLVLTN